MDFKALAALEATKWVRTRKARQEDAPFAQPTAHIRRGQPEPRAQPIGQSPARFGATHDVRPGGHKETSFKAW